MTQRHYRFAVLILNLAVATAASAQGPQTLTIDPAGEHTRVYLSYTDAAAEKNFAPLFEIPHYRDYQPFTLVLTNASGQPLLAVTIRWTATRAGRAGVYDSSTDCIMRATSAGTASMARMPGPAQMRQPEMPIQLGYSSTGEDGSEVVANGERMLVAPGLFARESVISQGGRSAGSASIPDALLSAETISATLDVVVLEDGTVLGPDASHTVDALRARKAAIDGVIRTVRAAEQSGQDGVEALRQLARARPAPEGDPGSFDQGRVARMLMMSPRWKERLEELGQVRLPEFHR